MKKVKGIISKHLLREYEEGKRERIEGENIEEEISNFSFV